MIKYHAGIGKIKIYLTIEEKIQVIKSYILRELYGGSLAQYWTEELEDKICFEPKDFVILEKEIE